MVRGRHRGARRASILGRTLLAAALIAGAGAQGAQAAGAPRDEAADRQAIEQLTIEYSYRLDHGRANELAELFTPDGVFDNPNLHLRAVGREAIAAYYAKRAADPRTTRHVSTNLHLVFETPDRAVGTRIITYYRGDGVPPFPAKAGAVGEYAEVFERGKDGKWRFASRRQNVLFGAPSGPP